MADDGSTGGIGRTAVALVTATAAVLTALAALGVKVASSDEGAGDSPSTSQIVTPADPTSTVAVSVPDTRPTTTEPPEPPEPAEPVEPAKVAFTVDYRLRTELGQISEQAQLLIDGAQVESWTIDGFDQEGAVDVRTTPGRHQYEFRGTYEFYDLYGLPASLPMFGTGVVDVHEGAVFTVAYDQFTGFSLVATD